MELDAVAPAISQQLTTETELGLEQNVEILTNDLKSNSPETEKNLCSERSHCESGCCVQGLCMPTAMFCGENCNKNLECNSGCCSFGSCTAYRTCLGQKLESDTCTFNRECITGHCNLLTQSCATKGDGGALKTVVIVSSSVFAFLILLFVLRK